MKKPIIGISCNLYPATKDRDFSRGRDVNYLQVDYASYIVEAGGIPVLLPVLSDQKSIDELVDTFSALVLSGGADVAPQLYKEDILDARFPGETKRARFEIDLLHSTHKKGKPVLGICRGLQVINVAFGGTLYQDLNSQCNVGNHQVLEGQPTPFHDVHLKPGSQLCKIIGNTTIHVNSSHHQAVKTPAPDFSVTAEADDGVIEGLEFEDSSFIVGVQWHPERLEGQEAESLARYLVELAYEGKRRH